jgi:hypothetical protein
MKSYANKKLFNNVWVNCEDYYTVQHEEMWFQK